MILAGCSSGDDEMQLATCRKVLAAITADAPLRELRVQPMEHAVRIDYLLTDDQRHARFVACRARDGIPVDVATERGRFGEGRLYALLRYGLNDKYKP